ncbi:hypothetical protein NP493_1627g01008 [Ridgeia piscesae]|uniref:Uncharacterized protein n=1 Tax=Ridgeia piscesae TaxID=27915 RepID=A0AAD9JWM0_RIDPI|nr:hypothetical protein NP493_1627g01008 [Ridgeia piscesae]
MGGEGTLNTRRGVGSCAACRIQHSQYKYWHAKQKTPGLVRHQRPGATDSYEQRRPSPPGALDPPLQHIKMPADCYTNAPRQEGLLQWTEGSVGTQKQETCSPEIYRWNVDLL